MDEQLTDDELDGIIQEIDTDGSGTVDFDGETLSLINLVLVLQPHEGFRTIKRKTNNKKIKKLCHV